MHLRSIRPIVLKFQKCWIFNGLDQRYAIVHSRVSFIKSILFFSFSKSLCYFGHLKCIYWICYIHMLFCYSLQKKSLIPFVKNLVPFLCNRVDSKGITFESFESAGEFTLANQIFLTFHFLRHFFSFVIIISWWGMLSLPFRHSLWCRSYAIGNRWRKPKTHKSHLN